MLLIILGLSSFIISEGRENDNNKESNKIEQFITSGDKMSHLTILSDINLTSCEDFTKNTSLPDTLKLINVDWQLFYMWNTEERQINLVRFSLPSRALLNRFSNELDDDLPRPFNWSLSEWFLSTNVDFSALLLKTERPSLYQLVPTAIFQMSDITNLWLGVRLSTSGHLTLMHCNNGWVEAFAPADNMPKDGEVHEVAANLYPKGNKNMSYIEVVKKLEATRLKLKLTSNINEYSQDANDVETEISSHHDKLVIF